MALSPITRTQVLRSSGPRRALFWVWEKTALGRSFIAIAIGRPEAAQCGPMISLLRPPIT
jgi:hypothetical protein